jgi:hypothetical protein
MPSIWQEPDATKRWTDNELPRVYDMCSHQQMKLQHDLTNLLIDSHPPPHHNQMNLGNTISDHAGSFINLWCTTAAPGKKIRTVERERERGIIGGEEKQTAARNI